MQLKQIAVASASLDAWIEREQFKGWDPHDALNSPLIKRLTLGNRRLGQVWLQLLKHSPVNLRTLLGIDKGYNAKAMGLFLSSYWRKFCLHGQLADLERVRFFLDWLRSNASPDYSGACWGYNFDWPNRSFFALAGTPTIVNTAFIGLALMDLITLPDPSGSVNWGNEPLNLARSACEFILRDLWVDRPAKDERCFCYTPLDRRYVHNANVLGAWLLAEVGSRTGEQELLKAARESACYTIRRQQAGGSWRYGESPGDGWVDNFHTGYVLVALKRIAACLCTQEFEDSIFDGYRFWQKQMFLPDGTPKYYPSRIYPIDSHSVAQAIITFLYFAAEDPGAIKRACQTANWGISKMQAPEGYFFYQLHRNPNYSIRIPYMRWSQAWMQRALVELEAFL